MMSAERIEQVLALRRAGWLYDQIARKLGVSRGAVAGVVDRARKAGEVFAPGERPKRSPKTRPAPAELVATTLCVADAPAEPICASFGRKAFFQLREGDCRFPFGDMRQGGVSFCGEPALEGRSWCRAHAEIVYRPKEGARRG
jgi:GcrA cell cycle regulator